MDAGADAADDDFDDAELRSSRSTRTAGGSCLHVGDIVYQGETDDEGGTLVFTVLDLLGA